MSRHEVINPASVRVWPGLGSWNLYFILKFVLLWAGYLNLQVLPNLVFAAALLTAVEASVFAHPAYGHCDPRWRCAVLPGHLAAPFSRLLDQPGVMNFTGAYMVELAGRFIDWNLCALLAALVVGYAFVRHWLRLTTLSVLGLAWLASVNLLALHTSSEPVAASGSGPATAAVSTADPDSATLEAYLQKFYTTEAARHVEFTPATSAAQPFDLLLINICSMAWDDLESVDLRDNTLLQQMDVIFDNFNSATSYSGPAAIRLLRASCGQLPHSKLYSTAPDQCMLMDDLSKLGFSSEVMLNHSGQFEGFLDEVRAQGSLPPPTISAGKFPRALVSFDGSPIVRDAQVLDAWWKHREEVKSDRVALFYNTTTLHDGNRTLTADGGSTRSDYKPRAQGSDRRPQWLH